LPRRRSQSAWARRIAEFIGTGLRQPVTVSEMAEYMGMVPNAFQLRFRKEFGASPADFFLHSRVDCAARMLRGERLPIKEISRSMGFSSSRYFTTVFRRCIGQTPKAYRQAREALPAAKTRESGR